MKRMLASLLMTATIGISVAVNTSDASAYWRRWGWGPGVAAGVIGGAIVAGAIIASRPPGYAGTDGNARSLSRLPIPPASPAC